MPKKKLALPRENLYRAVHTIPDLVSATTGARAAVDTKPGTGRTLCLQWSVSNVWTEIDSWYEGNFMERIAPGACKRTIANNRPNMRTLLQHGQDPTLGQKPIASIDVLEENEIGGYSEGELFEGLDPLLVAGLRAGQYGASFRFRVLVEELVDEPTPSDYNPKGLPERTIKEMAVQEFGPVTWGAYSEASAGVRSLTDEIQFVQLRDMAPERLGKLAAWWKRATRATRTDSEDMGTLAQMIALGSMYIEEQDEPDDAPNIPVMEGVLTTLTELMAVEAAEIEPPDEPEDEENASAPAGMARPSAPVPSARDAGPGEGSADATPRRTKDYLTSNKEKPPWHLG